MQETRSTGSQKVGSQEQLHALCENSSRVKIRTVQENSRSANFSICTKLHASHFRPRTTPFCIFSNFTPDVITFDMGILVFHFFVR